MSPAVKILALIGLLGLFSIGCVALGWLLRDYRGRYPSPPSTKRQLKRADRANRADLRALVKRYPREYVPMPLDHFDHGETQ